MVQATGGRRRNPRSGRRQRGTSSSAPRSVASTGRREHGSGCRGPEAGEGRAAWAPAPPPGAAAGEAGAAAGLLGGEGLHFPPPGLHLIVAPPGGGARVPAGRAKARTRGWLPRYCGLIGSPALYAHLQEKEPQKASPLKERGDWVSEETTKPSMQSGMLRGQASLIWRKWRSSARILG